MRRKVIAGNWKMNMLPNETIKFIDELTPLVKDTRKRSYSVCTLYRFILCSFNSTKHKH